MLIILARVAPAPISKYDFATKGSVLRAWRNPELERGQFESQKPGRLGPRAKLRTRQTLCKCQMHINLGENIAYTTETSGRRHRLAHVTNPLPVV
jgi:hypothetical protein